MTNSLPSPLFSFKGTVSRKQYLMTCVYILMGAITYIAVFSILDPQSLTEGTGRLIYATALLLLLPFSISMMIRRLRGLEMSFWWLLTLPIPIINIYIYLCLFLKKETK